MIHMTYLLDTRKISISRIPPKLHQESVKNYAQEFLVYKQVFMECSRASRQLTRGLSGEGTNQSSAI